MRLLTANLYSGRASVSSFQTLLDSERPDVVVCEEVGEDMVPMLRERFAHGVVWGDDSGHSGRAMTSNQPIEVEIVESSHRATLRGRADIANVTVEILGVHLANPINYPRAISDRRDQVDSILGVVAESPHPLIVTGDFNATPMWTSYRRLNAVLADGVSEGSVGRSPRPTWAPRPGWPAVLRIDHIFTRGIRLTDVSVARIGGSDHRSVSASLRLEPT